MTLRISNQLAAIAAVLALAAFGCATSSEDEGSGNETGSEFETGDQDEVEDVVVNDTPSTDVSMPIGNLATVYFEFDRASIRSDARPILRANGDQLRTASVPVRLEGYCDERGDEEYNLALGERRANSVKQYLENLGVDGSQLRTLSYGEAKPAVPGHTEEAWRYNRRVEFHVRR